MRKTYLDPPEWYASLPTVYLSACMLLTDQADRVLLVKPNYRPYWAIPGGIVDDGEPPHQCAVREVAEELHLHVTVGDLLVVDWPWDEAATKLPATTAARIPAARTARKNHRTIYLPAEQADPQNLRE